MTHLRAIVIAAAVVLGVLIGLAGIVGAQQPVSVPGLEVLLDQVEGLLTTIAGGVKAEDAPHISGDAGTPALCVRQNSQADLAADGDYIPCTVEDGGGMRVFITGGSSAGPSDTDDGTIAGGQSATLGVMLAHVWNGTNWVRATTADATHDAAVFTTGPQVQLGALAHGADPTAVTAGDAVRWSANRDGVPFVMGGHPNIVTREAQIEDADGAQTNAAIVTVSAGTKIVVTAVAAHCDGSTTNPTNIVVGFGTATLPARAHTGTSGILAAFDGVPAGGGMVKGTGSGMIGIGADDEDVRITTEDPVGGACSVELTFYLIES